MEHITKLITGLEEKANQCQLLSAAHKAAGATLRAAIEMRSVNVHLENAIALREAIAKDRAALEGVRDEMVNTADIHARVGKEPLFRTPKERHSDLGAAGALYSHAAKLTAFLEGGTP